MDLMGPGVYETFFLSFLFNFLCNKKMENYDIFWLEIFFKKLKRIF
jgi:hypothetical protein